MDSLEKRVELLEITLKHIASGLELIIEALNIPKEVKDRVDAQFDFLKEGKKSH